MADYGLFALDGPNSNWLAHTLIPLVRVVSEFLIGAAFGQAVDLMLSGAPIIERFIVNKRLDERFGRAGPAALFFLRNPSPIFAVRKLGGRKSIR